MQFWKRQAGLFLKRGDKVLDLSQFRFTFQTSQVDDESPNNCQIRVYNVSRETCEEVAKEFTEVVLQAGYNGSQGLIFEGGVRQYRIGKESPTDTYLDILAADGDFLFKYGQTATSIPAGTPQSDALKIAVSEANKSVASEAGKVGASNVTPSGLGQYPATGFGGVYPRGKVMLGSMSDIFRNFAQKAACTWTILNGQVHIIPLDSCLDGPPVDVNVNTGLIGMPETTEAGIKLKTLLNHKIFPGMRIRLNNREINQTLLASNTLPVAYNSYTKTQLMAVTAADGLYRVYVAEHEGDTRGANWYTNIIALAIDESTGKVMAN